MSPGKLVQNGVSWAPLRTTVRTEGRGAAHPENRALDGRTSGEQSSPLELVQDLLQFPLCFIVFICFQEQKQVYGVEETKINL